MGRNAKWISTYHDLYSVIYWHPHHNMQNLMDIFNSTIEKFDWENKFSIILGDFNLDLLKLDSHLGTENFFKYFGVLQLSTSYFTTYSNY